jgi:hypothetical protein
LRQKRQKFAKKGRNLPICYNRVIRAYTACTRPGPFGKVNTPAKPH